jgi:hypothetical protein
MLYSGAKGAMTPNNDVDSGQTVFTVRLPRLSDKLSSD